MLQSEALPCGGETALHTVDYRLIMEEGGGLQDEDWILSPALSWHSGCHVKASDINGLLRAGGWYVLEWKVATVLRTCVKGQACFVENKSCLCEHRREARRDTPKRALGRSFPEGRL